MKRHLIRPLSLTRVLASSLLLGVFALGAAAHEDHQFDEDRQPPYDGPGWKKVNGGSPSLAFVGTNIELRSWITLLEFNSGVTSADDCWGYVSPSGREYALIGLSLGTGFVEVTNPDDAQIIAVLPGPTSIWRDLKVYQHYAYAVSEGGGGIQVFDLSQIDQGVVQQVNTVLTGPGTSATHNVAINEESGFLYRVGGGSSPIQGFRVYDLSDPAAPAYVTTWNNRYCHDVQAVNYVENNGPTPTVREIVFCYANDTSGGGNPGIAILDVTDKLNIFEVGSINLAAPPIFSHPARFSHQGWLSPDRNYIYFGDEVDEGASPFPPTTTRIIDVSDLANPVQMGVFSNGNTSRDHNVYTRDNWIFEANYRSGLRIFDATDQLNPVEVAYYDTYPGSDSANYNGLWNVFPYFPSGTIIGSDIERGLFVWRFNAPADPPAGPNPAAGYPHAALKNRYVSFSPDASLLGTPHAYRVQHVGSGSAWYVSTPRTTPVSIDGQGLCFLVSDPAPPLHDFASEPVLHVGGCMIAPGQSYEVRTTTDGILFSDPLVVSTASQPTNGRWWADVAGLLSAAGDGSTIPPTPTGAWTPPDGLVSGFDVTAILGGFVQSPSAAHFTWLDLNPERTDRVVNGNDILQAVNAFSTGSGKEFYPFAMPLAGPQGQPICPAPPLSSALSP